MKFRVHSVKCFVALFFVVRKCFKSRRTSKIETFALVYRFRLFLQIFRLCRGPLVARSGHFEYFTKQFCRRVLLWLMWFPKIVCQNRFLLWSIYFRNSRNLRFRKRVIHFPGDMRSSFLKSFCFSVVCCWNSEIYNLILMFGIFLSSFFNGVYVDDPWCQTEQNEFQWRIFIATRAPLIWQRFFFICFFIATSKIADFTPTYRFRVWAYFVRFHRKPSIARPRHST